jgi:hypothetical protein
MSNPINKYVSFWIRFLQICKDSNLAVATSKTPFRYKFIGDDKYEISLYEPIYLQDWPEQPESSKKIDILVDGYELINVRKLKIIKSTVAVNYLDNSKRIKHTLGPLESIHYDYEETPQVGHPIFHAQLSTGLINSFRSFQIDPPNLDRRLKGIRIPTAHMSLITVLIGLIADHSYRENKEIELTIKGKKTKQTVPYAPVLGKIIKDIKGSSYPVACCKELHALIGNDSSSFRGILWYPEFV